MENSPDWADCWLHIRGAQGKVELDSGCSSPSAHVTDLEGEGIRSKSWRIWIWALLMSEVSALSVRDVPWREVRSSRERERERERERGKDTWVAQWLSICLWLRL